MIIGTIMMMTVIMMIIRTLMMMMMIMQMMIMMMNLENEELKASVGEGQKSKNQERC